MKVLASNRKAKVKYDFLENYEAGIVLTGSEVKSAKAGHVSVDEAFAVVREGEVFIVNMYIAPYEKSFRGHEPRRSRKLLLHKSEIKRITGKLTQKGLTLVPLSVYVNDRGYIKVKIALAKGKKSYDRREEIKKRDLERELARKYKLKL